MTKADADWFNSHRDTITHSRNVTVLIRADLFVKATPDRIGSAPPFSAVFSHGDLTFALRPPNDFKRVRTVTSSLCSADPIYCEIRGSRNCTDKDYFGM